MSATRAIAVLDDDSETTGRRRSPKWSGKGLLATIGLQLGALVGFLALWEFSVWSGAVNEILVPPPSAIGAQLVADVLDIFAGGPMAGHFFTTLSEILVGFGLSVVIGVTLGAALSEFPLFRRAVYPYVIALNTAPRIAFAPLFIIWFGFGLGSKVAMVVAIATFPILINTMAGLLASDPDTLKLARSLGATRMQTFYKIRFRTALPYVFAGLETGIIFAAVGAVVAEFTAGNQGLGYVTLVGQELFQLDRAFSAIILMMLQGFLLHRTVVYIGRRMVFWQTAREVGA